MSDEVRLIEVREEIHADNARVAQAVRARLGETHTFLLNLMSGPGAGKTSLILRTIDALRDRFRFGVLEADIDSTVDAERIAAHGIRAVQLRTGGFCHLDASMVGQGLDALDLDALDVVIVENVGNLVCPASFDLGEACKVVVLSVTEGEDKPLKYPATFVRADLVVLNKIDLLPYVSFDLPRARENAKRVHPGVDILEVSCTTGQGIEEWLRWVEKRLETIRKAGAR